MSDVRIISNSIVQAANQHESSRIDLTPWDLTLLQIDQIQAGLVFPKPTPQQEKETLIHNLKSSLSKALDYFPPLAGRLAIVDHEDNTISYFIDCNNAGALFIHAAADAISISDIIQPVYVPKIVHSFFPLNGLRNYHGGANPLLGVQVTTLSDGIFIGCTMNHTVADGSSFWHFINFWSEISRSRGSNSIPLSKLPVFQRWLPNGIDFPIRIPKSHLKQVNAQDQLIIPLEEKIRIFHFTRETIAKLKAKANAELGNGTNNISTLQALLSHIWRSIIRNTKINYYHYEVTQFVIPTGARYRLQELPESYFGNATQAAVVTMKVKELLEEGIGRVAWEMNKKIAAMTEQSLKTFLVSWSAKPGMAFMDSSVARKCKMLVLGSSPRFNVYGNDFGWGKPIALRFGPANKHDFRIAIFCGAEEGSIDIEACLSLETLEAMENDEEFMDTVAF